MKHMTKRTNNPAIAEIENNAGSFRWFLSEWLLWIGVLMLVGLSVGEVVNSWTVLSATYDEPFHVASGMEWLDKGTYNYEAMHPPLARVAVTLGPYLKGLRSFSLPDPTDEGNAILYSVGNGRSNLIAARSGNLPFLALASLAIFLWARRWFSKSAAIWAVLLFINVPPILGHGSLATLDMACAATIAIALYAFIRCLEESAWRKSILLGAALAFALLCKFSSIVFLGACVLCTVAYFALKKMYPSPWIVQWRPLFGRVLIVCSVTFVLLWAGYRFSYGPLSANKKGRLPNVESVFAKTPVLRSLVYKAIDIPVPFPPFFKGIQEVKAHNAVGHDTYLFGEYRKTGWWYFFPVVILVKTPIGFLILAGGGIFAILRRFKLSPWQQHLTLIFPFAILLVCMGSKINLGVRHILAIYPLLAVIGGHAVAELLALAKRKSMAIAVLPLLLVAWVVAESWQNRADHLAYFNQFAGSHPERILVESDLDWGQDLYRLSDRLKELRVDHVSLAYFGSAPLEKADLPPYSTLSPKVPPPNGYVAVSVRFLTLENAKNGSFDWLKGHTPLEKVGKSIYLYKMDQ